MSYNKEINLNDNEIPAKVNTDTGEVKVIRTKSNNVPEGKEIHKYDSFSKVNQRALNFLTKILSNEELGIILKMIQKSDYETNVMKPLNDETSYRTLAKEFDVNKNRIKDALERIFKLGAYMQVKVYNGEENVYWTLNPFIAWKGKFIPVDIKVYFDKTDIAKAVI